MTEKLTLSLLDESGAPAFDLIPSIRQRLVDLHGIKPSFSVTFSTGQQGTVAITGETKDSSPSLQLNTIDSPEPIARITFNADGAPILIRGNDVDWSTLFSIGDGRWPQEAKDFEGAITRTAGVEVRRIAIEQIKGHIV